MSLRFRVTGALSLLGLLLGAAARAAAQEDAGFVNGTVTDSADGHPLESALVLVKGTLLRATTNLRGQFQLFPVPAGPQVILIQAVGYAAWTDSVRVVGGTTVDIAASLAQTTIELPGIVVTASRGEEEQSESPASVAVLSNRELVARNITTIDEALPYVPGVTLNNDDIAIRGSTGIANGVGSRVLILLDGHPALTGDGGEVDFEEIPLLDLERVEVVKGAYSALYGSNALGGVVNLITSPISETPSTLVRAHFGVYQVPSRYKFTDKTLTTQGLTFQHSRQVGGVGLRFFAGRETNDGYTDNNESGRWLVRVKAASAPGATHPWDAYALYAREIDHIFFAWRSPDQPFQVDTANRGDNERANKVLTGATITPLIGAHWLVKLSPYVNYNTLQNDYRENNNHHNAFKAGGTTQVVVTPSPTSSITFGVDGAHTIVTSNFLGDHHLNDAAGFAQTEVRVADPLKVVAGTRLDYHKSTGGAAETSLSPKLGLALRASEALSFRTSIGRGYRAPSAIEQFVNTTQFGFRVIPNPSLIGERAWSGEVGLTASRGRVWFDASAFQSDYRDLIGPAAVPDSGFGYFQFANIDRARIRGVDAGVRLRLLRGLVDFQATYLYLHSEDLKTHEPLPYRSRHNVTGTVDALGGLVGVDVRYRSRPDTVLVYPFDPRKSVTVVDLRLAYRVLGTGLQLKVSNLFQTQYTNVQERIPGAPRNISLTAYRGF
jgi:outer membrane receptor for ferrienterochelin and colicins